MKRCWRYLWFSDWREKGKLTDDDNDEFIKDQLMDMWEAVKDEFAKPRT
jgi:hypothetical protein